MKFFLIMVFNFALWGWNPISLLLAWVVASPFLGNIVQRPKENPFFGSYRLIDYKGYIFPGVHFQELFDYDTVVLLLLFLFAWFKRPPAPRRAASGPVRRIETAIGALVMAIFLSALFSHNVLHAMQVAGDTFGLCGVAYLVGKRCLYPDREMRWFGHALIGLALLLSVTCWMEYRQLAETMYARYEDAYRVTGPFRYWETLGIIMSMLFFVCWFRGATAEGRRKTAKQMAYAALALMSLWCVLRTQTRTVMLALAIGVTTVVLVNRGTMLRRSTVIKLTLGILCLLAVLVANPESFTESRFYQARLTNQSTKDGRAETYVAATRMFLSSPLIGIGLKNFMEDMKDYVSPDEVEVSSLQNTSCHSSYFVVAAECGLMGLVPLFLLVIYAFQNSLMYLRNAAGGEKAWGAAMVGMTIAYFMSGTFFDPFFDLTMQNKLYFMCLGATMGRLQGLPGRSGRTGAGWDRERPTS